MKKIIVLSLLAFCTTILAQTAIFSKQYKHQLSNLRAFCVVPAFDKGFVFAGQDNSSAVVVKTDSTGSVAWSKVYSASGSPYIKVICRTSDSCYAVAGIRGPDILCMKLKKNGDTAWVKAVVPSTTLVASDVESIQQTKDKGFIISSSEQLKAVVTKLDSAGNLQWQRRIVAGNFQNGGRTTKQLPDSSYMVLIFSTTQTSVTIANTTLIHLSKTGNLNWARSYNKPTQIYNWGLDMEVVEDGIVTLITSSALNAHALLKTDLLGNIVWCKSYSGTSQNFSNDHRRLIRTKNKEFVFGTSTKIFKTDSIGIPIWINDLSGAQPHFPLEIIETKNKALVSISNYYGLFADESHVITMDSLGNAAACTQTVPLAVYFEGWVATPLTPTLISGGSTASLQVSISTITVVATSGCPPPYPWGIEEQNKRNIDLEISPNPSSGVFNITTNEVCSYIITDCIGKLITHGNCNTKEVVDISNEANGIYILQIKDRGGKTLDSRKLIKK